MILKSAAKFEDKLIFGFKNAKNLVNFDLSTKKPLKNCTKKLHFDCPLYAKYITFDLKKYRGVIFYDTEESCKV